MIFTTHGLMDETTLRKVTGELDNDNEHTTWVEYWLGEELVHRSVSIQLKKPVIAFGEAAALGG